MEDQAAFDAAWHGGVTEIPTANDPEFAHTFSNVGLVIPVWLHTQKEPIEFVVYSVDGSLAICLLGDEPDAINFGGYIQDTLNNVRSVTRKPRLAWLTDGRYVKDPTQ